MQTTETIVTLFGSEEVPRRGRHYMKADGYGDMPGTGPDGETCRTCVFCVRVGRGRIFPKCELARASWTHGRKTDILVKSPACRLYKARQT